MAKEKLKGCPFCGAQPVHGLMKVERCQLHGEPFQRARVNCPHGHAEIIGSSLEEAKVDWNKRLAGDELQDARRIATNAEHYGYLQGLEAAVLLAKKMQADALTGSAREHAGHFEEVLRALIPSEPHDAEGRE